MPMARAGYTTRELKTKIMRPVGDRQVVVPMERHAVHLGRKPAVTEARLVNATDKLYVTASKMCQTSILAQVPIFRLDGKSPNRGGL